MRGVLPPHPRVSSWLSDTQFCRQTAGLFFFRTVHHHVSMLDRTRVFIVQLTLEGRRRFASYLRDSQRTTACFFFLPEADLDANIN